MKMFNKKGFTLIELLVVIAIIGILASIVLVSFPSANKKAKDSRVISAISQARTTMQYVYGDDVSYANFSTSTPAAEMPALNTEIDNNIPSGGSNFHVIKKTDNSAACMYASLSTGFYCADSTGVSGKTASITTCVAATATCGTVTG